MKDRLPYGNPDNMSEVFNTSLKEVVGSPQGIGVRKEKDARNRESIVVLVGPIAAGKGTAANLLIKQGYAPFNYGDVIYVERTARGLPEERKNSNAVGAILRLQFGNDIIARKLGESIQEFRDKKMGKKILIDGLRHPDEVTWAKKNLGAHIIGINASRDIRFQRVLRRNRIVDPKSLESFAEIDQEDRQDLHEYGNQSDACLRLADVIIENNDEDIEGYKKRFNEALKSLGIKEDAGGIL